MLSSPQVIWTLIPRKCPDLNKALEGTNLNPDRMRILINQILSAWIQADTQDHKSKFHLKGYTYISSVIIKSLLTNKYLQYLNWAIQNNIIEPLLNDKGHKSYMTGQYCTPYRIHPTLQGPIRKEPVYDINTIKSVINTKQKFIDRLSNYGYSRIIPPEPIHQQLIDMVQEFHLDRTHVEKIILKTKRALKRRILSHIDLNEITKENGEQRCIIDVFGERLHTPFTRIPRKLRDALRISSQPETDLAIIDISNSQPYFAALAINHPELYGKILPEFTGIIEGLQREGPNTKLLFLHYCATGKIYETWATARGISREESKNELIKAILFSKSHYKRNVFGIQRKLFATMFPDVWDSLEHIKGVSHVRVPFVENIFVNDKGEFEGDTSSYKNLSCMLQRFESRVFLRLVAQKLLENKIKPFITVHDSIILPKSQSELAITSITKVFSDLKVTPPTLKVSFLNRLDEKKPTQDELADEELHREM